MKSVTRMYIAEVVDKTTNEVKETRLIEATHPDPVSAHVAKDIVKVRVATSKDVYEHRDLIVEVLPKKAKGQKLSEVLGKLQPGESHEGSAVQQQGAVDASAPLIQE